MTAQRHRARDYLTDAERNALDWIIAEAIDLSNARRPGLPGQIARQEWDDLRTAVDILAGPERAIHLQQLGPPP